MLKGYGIRSCTIRDGNTTYKGYYRKDFDDAFARYLPAVDKVSVQDSEPTLESPYDDIPF